MTTTVLDLELPQELMEMLGSEQAAAARARELLVLDLLREVRISQGQAAHYLDLSLSEMMSLMARHQIASGPETAEEVIREVEELRRLLDWA